MAQLVKKQIIRNANLFSIGPINADNLYDPSENLASSYELLDIVREAYVTNNDIASHYASKMAKLLSSPFSPETVSDLAKVQNETVQNCYKNYVDVTSAIYGLFTNNYYRTFENIQKVINGAGSQIKKVIAQ